MSLRIDTKRGETALELADTVARQQVTLGFPGRVSPSPVDSDAFAYPVDRAVAVTTDGVVVEAATTARVLDESGRVQADVTADSAVSLPSGTYYLSIASHINTYLWVDAPDGIEIRRDHEATTLDLDFRRAVDVRIGVRSAHERPEATITVTPDARDAMAAVSYFGTALKDDGPMRSFPSLRGHPPDIELGEAFRVSDDLEKPETGITIRIPPSYEHLYPVATLAYYLGAEVVPGDWPHVSTDAGFEYALDWEVDFERTVDRVLRHLFTCDCFVRAAGPYSQELQGQSEFERDTGIDPADAYDRSIAEQFEAYLSVPFERVEPYAPEWSVGAHVEAVPENVGHLPFLAKNLAVVKSPSTLERVEYPASVARTEPALADGEYTRSTVTSSGTDTAGSTVPESPDHLDGPESDRPDGEPWSASLPTLSDGRENPSGDRENSSDDREIVIPKPLDVQEQRWIGDGIPLGADKPVPASYRNALERDPVEDDIEIAVVCNDPEMADEDEDVRRLLNAETPFDVRVHPHRSLSTEELRDVLRRGADFLHYVGHIDDDGFRCVDGSLDATTLDEIRVDAFFLNACQSFDQGMALVDAGAIAGAVTHSDVLNADAVRTGRSAARLLNNGFPLNTAIRLASREHDTDDLYTVVGDGTLQIAQAESVPHRVRAELTGTGEFDYCFRSFVTEQHPLGAAQRPTIDEVDGWSLVGSSVCSQVSPEALRESFTYEDVPVQLYGDAYWSTDVADALPSLSRFDALVDDAATAAEELRNLGADPDVDADHEGYRRARARLEEYNRSLDDAFEEFTEDGYRIAFQSVIASHRRSNDADRSGPPDR